MKGFIEINEVGSGKATLINVNYIETILQCPDRIRIYMTNNVTCPWVVKESYEEIVNKIKEAMETN